MGLKTKMILHWSKLTCEHQHNNEAVNNKTCRWITDLRSHKVLSTLIQEKLNFKQTSHMPCNSNPQEQRANESTTINLFSISHQVIPERRHFIYKDWPRNLLQTLALPHHRSPSEGTLENWNLSRPLAAEGARATNPSHPPQSAKRNAGWAELRVRREAIGDIRHALRLYRLTHIYSWRWKP